MSKFENFLIVSDLDGTFFGKKQAILDNNIDAIRYFQENGGLFTIATGRDYRTLDYVLPNAESFISGLAVLCNGAYLFDFKTKEAKDEIELDKAEFYEILKAIESSFPEIGYRISTHIGYICPRISPFMETKIQSYLPIIIRNDAKHYENIPWHKCVFCAEPEIIDKLTEFLKEVPMKNIFAVSSATTLMELVPKNSGKGPMILKLKKAYPDRTIVCVGDYANDLDMLEAADIAACPSNAIEEVKKLSSIHLCNHQEGCIADLIYKLESSIKE